MDTNKLLGYKIANIRALKKLTQQQLADKVATSRENIARYESGKTEPKAFMLRDICIALNVSADYLLGITEA